MADISPNYESEEEGGWWRDEQEGGSSLDQANPKFGPDLSQNDPRCPIWVPTPLLGSSN